MSVININTGLEKFRMIDQLIAVDDSGLEAEKSFKHEDNFLIIEALAQLAALHVRKKISFEKHAFLLKVQNCVVFDKAELQGKYNLYASLNAESKLGFMYETTAELENRPVVKAKLIIGTIDYNNKFRTEDLRDYYQKVYECLQIGIEKS